MRRILSRILIELAWLVTPSDWVWLPGDSFERNIYEAVRKASIDHEQLAKRLMWDRVRILSARSGTKR
jgi:hypothetical protein